MAGFTDSALEKKLSELNNSQQSIQTLSLWLIHHRKHHKTIVQVWFRELKKAKASRKLTFMYLANDVIQNSKKKGPEFSKEFSTTLSKAFAHVHECVADAKTKSGLERIINVWEDRNVYDAPIISGLRAAMKIDSPLITPVVKKSESRSEKSKRKSERKAKPFVDVEPFAKKKKAVKEEVIETIKSPTSDPPDAEELIKALQDLENCPSTDAVVREKIASLPPEVSDITLLEKIQREKKKRKLKVPISDLSAREQRKKWKAATAKYRLTHKQNSSKQATTSQTLSEDINNCPPENFLRTLPSQAREDADKLTKQVEEACTILADYNNRLTEELEDRKHVSKMLGDFTRAQRERVAITERKVEEFKEQLKRVSQVRNELKSHLSNLPDLTLLPSVTGGLAPLPSAGDLFNQP